VRGLSGTAGVESQILLVPRAGRDAAHVAASVATGRSRIRAIMAIIARSQSWSAASGVSRRWEAAMPDETDEPAERQDPGPAETPRGSDIAADDPGPIEIDFIMKGASPAFGDLLAGWDVHRGDAGGGQDDAAQ